MYLKKNLISQTKHMFKQMNKKIYAQTFCLSGPMMKRKYLEINTRVHMGS